MSPWTRAVVATMAVTTAAASAVGWSSRSVPASEQVTALDGGGLFRAKGCATCHDGPEATARVGAGPSLAIAASWAGSRRPGVTASDYLLESIRDPQAFISPAYGGGNGPADFMPTLPVTGEEADAIVAYLLADR